MASRPTVYAAFAAYAKAAAAAREMKTAALKDVAKCARAVAYVPKPEDALSIHMRFKVARRRAAVADSAEALVQLMEATAKEASAYALAAGNWCARSHTEAARLVSNDACIVASVRADRAKQARAEFEAAKLIVHVEVPLSDELRAAMQALVDKQDL